MLTGGKRYIGCCVVGQSLDGPVPVQQHFCNMLLDTLFLGARDGPLKASSRRGGVGWSCWGRRPCGGDCWPWGTGQKSGWHLSRTSHLKRFYETQWPHSKQRIQSVQFDISSHTYTTTIKMTDSPCSNCPHVHYSPSLLPSPTPSQGFPGDAGGKEHACQCRRRKGHSFNPWVGKIPWRRARQPTPVFLPEESYRTEDPSRLQFTGSQSRT